jgi:predicted RNase H-like HicB family nuclease
MTEYTVIYEAGDGNWSAYVPDLPGCIATAKTRQQLERRIREAIEFHLEGLRIHGEPIPSPTIDAGKVAVPTPSPPPPIA